jgi:parvulin-like peptidyl-prolyl isomerase
MLLSLCLFACFSLSAIDPRGELINEVKAIIYHDDGSEVILKSHIRLGLDGSLRTLRDIILEHLMVLDAKMLHMDISDADLDRYLNQLQKERGLTRESVKQMFKQLGLSYEEGLELLRRQQIVQQILDFRIRSDKRMIVDRQALERYYEEHPRIIPESFTLAQTLVPFEKASKEELDSLIESGAYTTIFSWDEFTVELDDLAEDKKFIREKNEGDIVSLEEIESGYEITRLVKKVPAKTIPLDEVYDEIDYAVKRDKYFQLIEEYGEDLLRKASIRFMRESDKQEVMGISPALKRET